MKKMRGFYILFASSVLASLGRIYSTFLAKPTQLTAQSTGGLMSDEVIKELQTIADLQYNFQTEWVNQFLVCLTLVLLLATLFFLIRKNQSAMIAYFAYLAAMVLYNTNGYLFTRKLAVQFQSSGFNSQIALYSFVFALLLTGFYIWMTFKSFGEKK